MGFDDALQVEGVAIGHPRRAGDGSDREACFWREQREVDRHIYLHGDRHLSSSGQWDAVTGLLAKPNRTKAHTKAFF